MCVHTQHRINLQLASLFIIINYSSYYAYEQFQLQVFDQYDLLTSNATIKYSVLLHWCYINLHT